MVRCAIDIGSPESRFESRGRARGQARVSSGLRMPLRNSTLKLYVPRNRNCPRDRMLLAKTRRDSA